MPILDVCEFAWRDRTGYAFLSTRNPQLPKEDPLYWVDHSFRWPAERNKLHSFVRQARREQLDLYWAPALFNKPRRSATTAQPVDLLWADLDAVDPNLLPNNLKPTAAWETSPGRFAAVWRLDEELEPQVQTKLNQRLTYTIGADKGGWGLSKVLRVPGTVNYKYPDNPRGRQLWLNGHELRSSQVLADLPELGVSNELHEGEDGRGDLPDPQGVMRAYHIPPRARAILRSKHADVGTRSDRLWQLECLLAEAGLCLLYTSDAADEL